MAGKIKDRTETEATATESNWKWVAFWTSFIAIPGAFFGSMLWQNYQDSKANSREIYKLWTTLQKANEILDEGNKGPDSDNEKALKAISAIEKEKHPKTWNKYVAGTEGDFDRFLTRVTTVVKDRHPLIYETVGLKQESDRYIAKSDIDSSWQIESFPAGLAGLAYNTAKVNSMGQPVSAFPFASISRWTLVTKGSHSKSSLPTLDLSDKEVRSQLSELANKESSKELAALALKTKGVLVPEFTTDQDLQNCFETSEGLVEINYQDPKCKTSAENYLVAAKAKAIFERDSGAVCGAALIRLKGMSVDIDPCLAPGSAIAASGCQRSIEAYIRKMTKQPDGHEDTHRNYLLQHCKDEIGSLKKQQRALFEGPSK
ncbi:hypothetical protein [Bdellovibrio sp. HCB337]|uniref:hypothetical protein n=1 Tax=Bdellovibrio sp. HCB337 TaxID=3394358 RepID=UPI0039A4DFB2